MKHKINVLVIDAQGGGIGRQLVAAVKEAFAGAFVTAVGTNGAATSAMLKAGADKAATGENAVCYNAAQADLILGPIGLLSANALMGEVSPAMAAAVSAAKARRILVPVSSGCGILVAGAVDRKLEDLLDSAVELAAREVEA